MNSNANSNSVVSTNSNLDITIRKVSVFTSARYIAKVLLMNKIATVRSIKFIPFQVNKIHYKRAVIEIASWMDSSSSITIQERLQNKIEARLAHKDENVWKIIPTNKNDLEASPKEWVFFKIQNTKIFGNVFKGKVQKEVKVHNVLDVDYPKYQYVYYNEPAVERFDENWSKSSPNEIINYFSKVYEVLDEENDMIVGGLAVYAKSMVVEGNAIYKKGTRPRRETSVAIA